MFITFVGLCVCLVACLPVGGVLCVVGLCVCVVACLPVCGVFVCLHVCCVCGCV